MITRTGVKAVFSASHTDPVTGALHGHDYVVIAWWRIDEVRRFEVLRQRLKLALSAWDHAVMPEDLWSAEAIARTLMGLLDLDAVEVNRPEIGHFVRVER